MDKSDIAGILGLLLGGAGGYYGGKKRSEREEQKLADYFDMMKELEGGSDVNEVDTEILSEYTPYGSQSGDLSGNKSDISTDSFYNQDESSSPIYNQDDFSFYDPLLKSIGIDLLKNPFRSTEELMGEGYNFGGLAPFVFGGSDGFEIGQNTKADGGRVGLANGGLGYSYKNNIFSADPSTGIPAVVDAGGVANNTFMDLYPGMFDDSTEEDITSMPPILPLLTGGGGQMMKNENDYSANPDGTIGFQNSAYDGILGGEYKDRPIGDEFTLGTSPLSDYGDIFNPNEIGVPSKKKGFFDAYGKFVGSDDMPLGTLPGAQFQDFFTDDEGNFDFTKAIPFSTAFKTLDNFLSNVLGFKTDTDSDPEQYDKVKDPMKAFKDLETKTLDAMEKDLANQAAKDRTKIGPGAKVGSLGQGGGQDRSGGLSGSGSGAGKGGLGAGGQGGKNKGTARF